VRGDRQRGREAFEQGVAAVEEDDWRGAHEAFARSYALDPNTVNAYQLAQSLHHLGRDREALEVLEVIDAGELRPPLDQTLRRDVERLRDEASESLGTLVIANPLEVQLTLRVDGRPEGAVAPGAIRLLRVDAGQHAVRIGTWETRVDVPRAGRVDLPEEGAEVAPEPTGGDVLMPREVARAAPVGTPRAERAHPRRARRVALGLTIGAVVLITLVAGLLAANGDDPSYSNDSFFGTTMALSR